MGQSVLQIILKVTKEGTGARDAAIEAKELKGQLTDLGLGSLASVTPLAIVGATIAGVSAFMVDAVKETVNYANEVRNMSMLTGQSAEDASRLLQVMDDLKVETSTLTAATKTLAKQGLTMNIETLAKLSDEYKALGNSADKTAFLVKNFGKTGLDMAEAMSKGGPALRGMSKDVEASLILDQKKLDASRLLEAELDTLNDAWLGIKVTVGGLVIPLLNDLYHTVDLNVKKGLEWTDLLRLNPILGVVMGLIDFDNAHKDLAKSTAATSEAQRDAAESAKVLAEADKAAKEAMQETTKANEAYITSLDKLQSQADGYKSKMKDLTGSRAEEKKKLDDLTKGYWVYDDAGSAIQERLKSVTGDISSYTVGITGSKSELNKLVKEQSTLQKALDGSKLTWTQNTGEVQKQKDKLAEIDAKIQETEEINRKATAAFLIDMIQQRMARDGLLDDREVDYILNLKMQNGLLTQATVDGYHYMAAVADAAAYNFAHPFDMAAEAAQRDIDKIGLIKEAQDKLQNKSIDIKVNYTYTGEKGSNIPDLFGFSRATGTNGWETVPAGYPNDSFPVMMSSGEKFAVIPDGGGFSPGGGGGAGGVVNVYNTNNFPTLSLADSEGLANALYPAMVAAIRRARSDGLIK